MHLKDTTILILGGSGLVGQAVVRRILPFKPRRMVLASLFEEDAETSAQGFRALPEAEGVRIDPFWGDLFVPQSMSHRSRRSVLDDADARRELVDDLYGELTEDVFRRSALGALLLDVKPDAIVDCINTAGALAYQNVWGSVEELRSRAAEGSADSEAVERHLSVLYLPQLIRHTQIALEGMKRAGTEIFVKIGTAGTGGMGLNIPFTHSEERPSRVLLAKASLAGAQSLLLFLMARTPGGPAVKEIKPTAAIGWKSIGFGPIRKGRRPVLRSDAVEALPVEEAFGPGAERGYRTTDEPLEGVFLDAGENGLFSLAEFETLTALGLMEFLTPEEIADNVLREIRGQPSGKDVVAALDGATMGPTYRAGVLRSKAIQRMEELEEAHGVDSIAYEMLGPPRLTKLLFEAAILRRLYGHVKAAAALDGVETSERARALIEVDADLRQRIVSAGIPILLPDGATVLRGAEVKVPLSVDGAAPGVGTVDRGWVDLRPENWSRWAERMTLLLSELHDRPGLDLGSRADHEYGEMQGEDTPIRPGHLGAWILRVEDEGERIKR